MIAFYYIHFCVIFYLEESCVIYRVDNTETETKSNYNLNYVNIYNINMSLFLLILSVYAEALTVSYVPKTCTHPPRPAMSGIAHDSACN
jgi:hypothetical protein